MSKLLWILAVLTLLSCGSRQVEITKENTSVKARTETNKQVVSDYKIQSNMEEINTHEIDDLNLSIIPNLDKNSLDKKCPKSDIVYKDKKGRELRLPYENQTINLSEVSNLKKEISKKDSIISAQQKEIEKRTENQTLQSSRKDKNTDKRQSLFFVGLGVGILLMSLVWAVYGRIKNKLKL